jgi:hypothetical protein
MIIQLSPTIEVKTPLGDGEAFFMIDYGLNVNTVWLVRLEGGVVKHFYSDDILIYGNPMNGKGWDVGDVGVKRPPAHAKRNMDFLTKKPIEEDDSREI